MSVRAALVAAVFGLVPILGACEHPEPYHPQPVPDNPTLGGPPRQLTFSIEGDHWPAWLPDGSAIGYSYAPLERTDRDRCLAFIPAEGGRIIGKICQHGDDDVDSTNAVHTWGASAAGRVALVADAGDRLHTVPDFRYLYLGRLGDTAAVSPALRFPYLTPSGRLHQSAAYIVWPSESTIVYLATYINYVPASINFPPDTVETGMDIVRLDLRGDTVVTRTIVPNTLGASSVGRASAGSVYYTMGGDSRVFALDLATLTSTTAYDFGALGIARDAQIEGGRLVAVVGGRVGFFFNPAFDIPQQADSGGTIYAVTLPAGVPVAVAAYDASKVLGSRAYRHLALAPSGRRVVAEMMKLKARLLRFNIDTVMSKQSDLWMFDVP